MDFETIKEKNWIVDYYTKDKTKVQDILNKCLTDDIKERLVKRDIILHFTFIDNSEDDYLYPSITINSIGPYEWEYPIDRVIFYDYRNRVNSSQIIKLINEKLDQIDKYDSLIIQYKKYIKEYGYVSFIKALIKDSSIDEKNKFIRFLESDWKNTLDDIEIDDDYIDFITDSTYSQYCYDIRESKFVSRKMSKELYFKYMNKLGDLSEWFCEYIFNNTYTNEELQRLLTCKYVNVKLKILNAIRERIGTGDFDVLTLIHPYADDPSLKVRNVVKDILDRAYYSGTKDTVSEIKTITLIKNNIKADIPVYDEVPLTTEKPFRNTGWKVITISKLKDIELDDGTCINEVRKFDESTSAYTLHYAQNHGRMDYDFIRNNCYYICKYKERVLYAVDIKMFISFITSIPENIITILSENPKINKVHDIFCELKVSNVRISQDEYFKFGFANEVNTNPIIFIHNSNAGIIGDLFDPSNPNDKLESVSLFTDKDVRNFLTLCRDHLDFMRKYRNSELIDDINSIIDVLP